MSAKKLDFISVDYLNSVPYQILEDYPGATLHFDTPARCAQLVHQRKVDWGLIPLVEFLNHGGYSALPYGIVAHGAVKSVCLYSEVPIEKLTKILLDTSSRSSVILLKVILHALLGDKGSKILLTRCEPERIPKRISENTAGLIIGDASLQFSAQHHHIIDLGAAWMQHTGLPFVFALWAARPEIVQQTDCRSLALLIEKGIATRVTRARAWAQAHGLDLQVAEDYISESIDFRIDKNALDGMRCFAEQASFLGLLPKNAPQFLDQLEIFPSFSRLLNQQNINQTAFPNSKQKISSTSQLDPSLDILLTAASNGNRLSILEGIKIAERAQITDLLLASSLRRYACHHSSVSLFNQNIVFYSIDWAHNPSHISNMQCQVEHNIVGLSELELAKIIAESSQNGLHRVALRDTIQTVTPLSYFKLLFAKLTKDPNTRLYAFSPDDIPTLAAGNNVSVQQFIQLLIEAGVISFANPYGNIHPRSIEKDVDLLSVHRAAHQAGMQTTAAMLYLHEETWEERIMKLYDIRQLQDETGGFCNFVTAPLASRKIHIDESEISLELLRFFAVARLFLDNISSLSSPPLLHQLDVVTTAIMADSIAIAHSPLIGFASIFDTLGEKKNTLLTHIKLAGLDSREPRIH